MDAQLHSGVRCLMFGLSLYLHPNSVYASRNGSDENADCTKISFAGPNMVRYLHETYLGNVVFN